MKSTKIILALVAAGAAIALTQQANAQYTLQGNYLEVGVGYDGSIINPNDNSAPDNYNQSGDGQAFYMHPGIIWNGAGTGFSGAYANNDFITPGTPYQMFSIGVNGSYAAAGYNNTYGYGDGAPRLTGGTTIQTGPLSTLTTGSYAGLNYSQTLSFTAGSSVIHFAMTLNNPTASPISGVAFATGLDPDPDVFQYEDTVAGSLTDVYNTINSIVSPGIVSATGPLTGNTIIIQGVTGGGVADVYASWPDDNPYNLLSGVNNGNGDYSIGDAWSLGTLGAGDSVTIDYNYIINATPVTSTSPILTGVPDGASTLGLLGLALTGLGLIRRKMKV